MNAQQQTAASLLASASLNLGGSPPGCKPDPEDSSRAQTIRPPRPQPSVFDDLFREVSGEFVVTESGKAWVEFDLPTLPRGVRERDDAAIAELERIVGRLQVLQRFRVLKLLCGGGPYAD